MKGRKVQFLSFAAIFLAAMALWLVFKPQQRAQAEPETLASPVHAGCYIAAPSDCRIHVEPFTITVASGEKLVYFQLLASRVGEGMQVIYDFRPDLSNPLPYSGQAVSPSMVAQDFAAICGETYSIWLQGKDTGDPNPYNLGATGEFTCPTNVP